MMESGMKSNPASHLRGFLHRKKAVSTAKELRLIEIKPRSAAKPKIDRVPL